VILSGGVPWPADDKGNARLIILRVIIDMLKCLDVSRTKQGAAEGIALHSQTVGEIAGRSNKSSTGCPKTLSGFFLYFCLTSANQLWIIEGAGQYLRRHDADVYRDKNSKSTVGLKEAGDCGLTRILSRNLSLFSCAIC
jgi:hypothetical protein